VAESLGPYEITGRLGKGAMAIVWRAYDPKLDREIAIKEPLAHADAADPLAAEFSARFVREGRAAAKLNHPGIVTIYAADVYDGRPAIVMELIDGETLADALRRGPFEPQTAAAILDQLLDAVAYAHERGVVHRDIKPDNIFLTREGRVKLADFGIAHVGDSSTLKTQAGTVMGTPGYMAPEQVVGSPADARSDLFSIGAIGYEMLSGRNPFGASDNVPATTIMYRIVHEEPPALPAIALVGAAPGLSSAILCALAKDPAARFADARAFRAALTAAPAPAVAPAAGVAAPYAAGTAMPAQARASASGSGRAGWWPYALVAAIGVLAIAGFAVFSAATHGRVSAQPPAAGRSVESPGALQQQQPVSGPVAATVNGEQIPLSEVTSQLAVMKTRYPDLFKGQVASRILDLKQRILDNLINQELINQAARQKGISVSDADVQKQFDELRGGFKSEAEFEQSVKSAGMDLGSLRTQIRTQLITQKLVAVLSADTKVTDADLQAYYDENKSQFVQHAEKRASHILFASDDKATASKVLAQLQAGSITFASAAQRYSIDSATAGKGGDLGWPTQAYIPEFQAALDKLGKGQMSELVKSQFGWHIILVTDVRGGRQQSLDEVRSSIEQTIVQQRRSDTYQDFLNQLRRSAVIKVSVAGLHA
jgi:parvulin-like peptidyl-prolyl isomerase/tRNA A-37 threonylcarbamoyl transferase component Bud32